jgi:hypothetical protein
VGKWKELENVILSKVGKVQKDDGQNVFSPIWRVDPTDKYIQKSKHDIDIYHIYTFIIEHVCNSSTVQ